MWNAFTRRQVWFALVACVAATTMAAASDIARSTVPHVVVILADDLGWGDLGCYGGEISTPHVDRLAQQGMRFTDAHSPSAVCTPTRYGILTGRYAWRSKLKRGVLGGLSPALIEPDRVTLGSLLQQAGYYSATIGKWHLGMNWVLKPGRQVTELAIESREQVWNVDYDQPIARGPTSVGFDHYFGISASLDMVPYTFIENDRVVASPTQDRSFLMTRGKEHGGRTRQGPAAPGFEATKVLPTLADQACRLIEEHASRRAKQPLLLYVPLTAPHTPILPGDDWAGRSDISAYADFVMQTDAAVGAIEAALERASMTENTLLVVTSDNGCSPSANFAELAAHDHHPSGPFRGHKADIYEGGHRVPFVVRWPTVVKPASVSDQLVCLTDLLATVAEIVDRQLPAEAGEDSISLVPVLRGETTPGRNHLISHSINGTFAIRKGDWKLILAPGSGGWSEPRPGSPQAMGLPARQLYSLKSDLGERKNLVAKHPERVADLHSLLERLVAEGRSTPGEPQANNGTIEIEVSN
jgi:arylsulfatase A-like enzyme